MFLISFFKNIPNGRFFVLLVFFVSSNRLIKKTPFLRYLKNKCLGCVFILREENIKDVRKNAKKKIKNQLELKNNVFSVSAQSINRSFLMRV